VLLYRRKLRVAAIAVVLRRGGPMSVGEILIALHDGGHILHWEDLDGAPWLGPRLHRS
jgi:hypothetical protein